MAVLQCLESIGLKAKTEYLSGRNEAMRVKVSVYAGDLDN